MKNILVTGGCGFIGSNFINQHFSSSNRSHSTHIVNIDAMYYCADEYNVHEHIRRDPHKYTLVKANICDYDMLKHLLQTYKIDTVIHFAAQSHVQDSFTDSGKYVQDNVVGTHTLLEACRIYNKIEKFIHISTDEVYGESLFSEIDQKDEQSILCPTNPYAATKASAELIASSYYHSFKMPIVITRGNNVYGPNQYPEKLIPRFIKLLKEGKKVTIQGDGTNIRGFLHVYDVASAIECILEKGEIGEIYNIGSDEKDEYTVMDIAKGLIYKIKKIKNDTELGHYIEYIEDRPFNDKRYFISNEKLKNLGWTITIPFVDGIVDLIDHH
jgi:dTDP-glucose 4,6-dehydratase